MKLPVRTPVRKNSNINYNEADNNHHLIQQLLKNEFQLIVYVR